MALGASRPFLARDTDLNHKLNTDLNCIFCRFVGFEGTFAPENLYHNHETNI